MWPRTLLSWCLVVLAVTPGSAQEAAWTLSRLGAELARDTRSVVRFSEQRRLHYLTEPLLLEGTLSFEPPDRLEKRVLRPKKEKITVDGNLVSIETNTKDPPVRVLLSDHPALDALITALRSVLGGDLDALEDSYAIVVDGEGDSWSLHMTPRSEALREAVREVWMRGSAGRIETIEILEAGGDQSLITITGAI